MTNIDDAMLSNFSWNQRNCTCTKMVIRLVWILAVISVYYDHYSNKNQQRRSVFVSSFHIPFHRAHKIQQQKNQWRTNRPMTSVSHGLFNIVVNNRDPMKFTVDRPLQGRVSSCALTQLHSTSIDSSKYYKDYQGDIPDSKFIRIVEKLSKQSAGRVKAIVAAKITGLSIEHVKRRLTVLATITGGDIAVDWVGDLVYVFPRIGIRSTLGWAWMKYVVKYSLWPVLYCFIRITFGMTILASLPAILFQLLLFLIGKEFGWWSGGFGLRSLWGAFPQDLIMYRPFGYSSRFYYDTDPEEMGFVESIFSSAFGDGNPNPQLDKRRLQLASQVIRQNNGVVTAEQLAPFCDNVPSVDEISTSTNSSYYIDESYILPLVTALNGVPEVTRAGDIVYVFPELQATNNKAESEVTETDEANLLERVGLSETAAPHEIKQLLDFNQIEYYSWEDRDGLIGRLQRSGLADTPKNAIKPDDVLVERRWDLTLSPQKYNGLLFWLGHTIFYWLCHLLVFYDIYSTRERIPVDISFLIGLTPYMWWSWLWWCLSHCIRNPWIRKQNAEIQQRNERRLAWKRFLISVQNSPSNPFHQKLQNAEQYRQSRKILNDTTAPIQGTKQSIEEHQRQKHIDDLFVFDLLLAKERCNNTTNETNELITASKEATGRKRRMRSMKKSGLQRLDNKKTKYIEEEN